MSFFLKFKTSATVLLIVSLFVSPKIYGQQSTPVRLGIAGLTHTHVHGILGREGKGDIEIVGIAEPNKELARRYADQYDFSMNLVYKDIDEMIRTVKPEAVAAFGSIREHLAVVSACAPKGIHVIVEKPLAFNMKDALQMEKLAHKHNIKILTNYETSWYPSTRKALEIKDLGYLGTVRKIVVHDGHPGPVEIGINKEFLQWLTDPDENGAGALTDFGCYGANIITWLNQGIKPTSVTAVIQTFKPDLYSKVDDEATIILEYPNMTGIIQASWNWPFSRKDMEVYGTNGYIFCDDPKTMRYRFRGEEEESLVEVESLPEAQNDPFTVFARVIRNEIELEQFDLSSLENNLIVVEILEAAIKSAASGRTIVLN